MYEYFPKTDNFDLSGKNSVQSSCLTDDSRAHNYWSQSSAVSVSTIQVTKQKLETVQPGTNTGSSVWLGGESLIILTAIFILYNFYPWLTYYKHRTPTTVLF